MCDLWDVPVDDAMVVGGKSKREQELGRNGHSENSASDTSGT